MATDVKVPVLGESITEGTLAQWLKKPGEAVKADEAIASLETDKVSVEVPSPIAGFLSEQLFHEGDNVAVGAVIARIDENEGAAAPPPAPSPAMAVAEATTNPAGAGETPALKGDSTAPVAEADDDHVTTLSPAVRRAVLEYHVDPTKIRGTGKDGRLTKDDVIAAAVAQKTSSRAQAVAEAPEAKAPAPERKGCASWNPAFDGERNRTPGRARENVAPAADHRETPEGRAEHSSHADDVQRRRHERRDRRA